MLTTILTRAGATLVLTLSVLGAALNMHVEPRHLTVAGLVSFGATALLVTFRRQIFLSTKHTHWPFVIAALLIFPFLVLRQYFGPFSLAALVFHAGEGLGRAAPSGVAASLASAGLLHGGALFVAHQLLTHRVRRSYWLTALTFALLVLNPAFIENARDVYWRVTVGSFDVAAQYRPVTVTSDGGERPDVVYVYLEGLERTYAQLGGAYDPIGLLEARGTAFTNVGQLPYTEWTTAGIVATQCGVPLLPRGLIQHNKLDKVDAIYPDVTCLGDVMRASGYQNIFVLGSDVAFGGKRAFFERHGEFEIIDASDLARSGASDVNSWGFNDGEVFEAAYRVLAQGRREGGPIFLNILTLGPHAPQGFLARECVAEGASGVPETILDAVACTASLTLEFIRRVEVGLPERKILFVLVSDHLAHPTVSAIGDLLALDRRNTALILGHDEGLAIDKPGTMVDLYPTVLEVLGYQLPEGRAGLGVSLLSDGAGLMSGAGYWRRQYYLGADRKLSDLLWR